MRPGTPTTRGTTCAPAYAASVTFGRIRRACLGRVPRVVVLFGLTTGCGYPTFGFVPDVASDAPKDAEPDTIVDAAEADVHDGAPCPVLEGGDACKTIPRLGAVTQIVDGIGDEFCGVPATKLIANSGAHMEPATPPPGIDTVMWTRIAWSAEAIHIHVRVDQALVYAPVATEELWRGDGIELFVSGASTLTGDYTATKQPGTFQIIAVPPNTGTLARAGVYYGSDGLQTFLDPAHFAARLTPTGYEIELRIEWTLLAATPSSGKVIGFDAAVDVRQTASSSLQLQSFIGYRAITGTSPCGARGPHPSCDDRTWCVPSLE
jgi:hypothetical protein